MYRVFSGPSGSERINPIEKDKHLFKEFAALDDAIGFAHHLKGSGRVALLIEGDDGTRLDRRDLAKVLHHRSKEQTHGAW